MATIDTILLERARKCNEQAIAEIYDRYAESIYRYLYRILGDANIAEDLTSDVFLKLLQVLGTSRAPRDQLQGWLYRVARNLAMDWFRQQAKGPTVVLNEELAQGSDSPVDSLEQRQTRQRLGRVLSRLTASQQQVILLRFGEGLKITEVGRLMGKSEGAIKLIQYRAVKRLRKLLEQEETEAHEQERSQSVRRVPAASSAGRKN